MQSNPQGYAYSSYLNTGDMNTDILNADTVNIDQLNFNTAIGSYAEVKTAVIDDLTIKTLNVKDVNITNNLSVGNTSTLNLIKSNNIDTVYIDSDNGIFNNNLVVGGTITTNTTNTLIINSNDVKSNYGTIDNFNSVIISSNDVKGNYGTINILNAPTLNSTTITSNNIISNYITINNNVVVPNITSNNITSNYITVNNTLNSITINTTDLNATDEVNGNYVNATSYISTYKGTDNAGAVHWRLMRSDATHPYFQVGVGGGTNAERLYFWNYDNTGSFLGDSLNIDRLTKYITAPKIIMTDEAYLPYLSSGYLKCNSSLGGYISSSSIPASDIDFSSYTASQILSLNASKALQSTNNLSSFDVVFNKATCNSIVINNSTNNAAISMSSFNASNAIMIFTNNSGVNNATSFEFRDSSNAANVRIKNNHQTNIINGSLAVSTGTIGDFSTDNSCIIHTVTNDSRRNIRIQNNALSGSIGVQLLQANISYKSVQFYQEATGAFQIANFNNTSPIVFSTTSTAGSTGEVCRYLGDKTSSMVVGIGYTSTPSVGALNDYTLGLAGDLIINGYRKILLNGGNSKGYLWTNFSTAGDTINLSYNYTETPAAYILNLGGETATLSVGYGSIKFKTGATNTAPSTKAYMYQNRLSLGKGDNIADAMLEIKSDGSDILKLTDSSGNGLLRFTNSGQLVYTNQSNVTGLQIERAGGSQEYTNLLMNGYFYLYPHVGVGSTTPIFQVPADTSESIQTTLPVRIGSMSNVSSGLKLQVDGNIETSGKIKSQNIISSLPNASQLYTATLIGDYFDTYPLYLVKIYGNASLAASETQTITYPNSFQAASDLVSKVVCTYAPYNTTNPAAIKFKDKSTTSVKIECIDSLDGTTVDYEITFFGKQTSWAYS